MKKLCIFLMKIHGGYYFIFGALLSLIVCSRAKNVQDMTLAADINPLIPIFVIFGIVYIQIFVQAVFYTEEERVTNNENGNIDEYRGMVMKDNYFSVKIDTELTLAKRVCAFTYSIVRAIQLTALSYTLFSIVCGLYLEKVL